MKLRAIALMMIALFALWLTFQSNFFLLVCKLVVDSFAISLSGAKVRLLFLSLSLLSLLMIFPPLWSKKWTPAFLVGLALLYCLPVAEHLYFCQKTDLPILPRTVCLSDGMMSATRLQHIHESKVALATLFDYTGQSFEMGRSFLAVFPAGLRWCHAALFLLVSIAGFLCAQGYARRGRLWASISFALVTFSMVKNSVDGGPLDTQTLAAFPFFLHFLGYSAKRGAIISLSLLGLNFVLSGIAYFWVDAWRFATATIVFALPLLWSRAHASRKYLLGCLAGMSLLVLLPALQYLQVVENNRLPTTPSVLRYAFQPLEEGWTVTLISGHDLSGVLTKDSTVEETHVGDQVRMSRVKLLRRSTPLELCDVYRLNITRRPVEWYQGPVYMVIEGHQPLPEDRSWRTSPLVTGYLEEENRLVLEMYPGGTINTATDAFGPSLYGAETFRLQYEKPPGDWKK